VAEVADDRAVLWLRAGAAERLRVRVAPVDDAAGGRRFEVQARPDWDHIVRVPLQGLRPAARYAYEVESGGERVEGSFTSAPPAEAAARVDPPGPGAAHAGRLAHHEERPLHRRHRLWRRHRRAGSGVLGRRRGRGEVARADDRQR
jgi:hypothetical protein